MGKGIIRIVNELVECFFEVLYPHSSTCLCCNNIRENEYVCSKCLDNISFVDEGYYLDRDCKIKCYSSAYYSGVIKELIIKLKYSSDFESGEFLSKILYNKINSENIKGDIITYVPLSKASLKKRGFNQCKAIGKTLSRLSGIPIINTLYRSREVKEQKRLSMEERITNMIGVFKVIEAEKIKDKNIILIDDVITTGATLINCRESLIKAGAKDVILLTVAKSTI